MPEPNKESIEILNLLDYIENLASRPNNGPKGRLIQAGKAANRIRALIFIGVQKQIKRDQYPDMTPENLKP